MSVKPSLTSLVNGRQGSCYLSFFEKWMAPVVTAWVRNDSELFWLAPNTLPPLTCDKVLAWPSMGTSPMLLNCDELQESVGYIELNLMVGENGHFWIGHCIIRPDQRDSGMGRRMVSLALDQAFLCRRADRVSLVVFPDNHQAIRCYQAVGFVVVGEQIKYFPASGCQHHMLWMSIDRRRYESIRHQERIRKLADRL